MIYHCQNRKSDDNITQSFILCNVIDEAKDTNTLNDVLCSQREVYTYWSGSLKAGLYCIIPFSISFWHREEQIKEILDFTLVIHSNVKIEGQLGIEKPTFLADCLIASVIKQCDDPDKVLLIVLICLCLISFLFKYSLRIRLFILLQRIRN
jgi:hypothetical protein